MPDGDARDILGEAGNATLVRPSDVEGMSAAIRAGIERSRAGLPAPSPDHEVVARFEYRKLASDLCAVFDAVLRRYYEWRIAIVMPQ